MNPFLASGYVHGRPDWPRFHYELVALVTPLIAARSSQGRLLGRMEGIGLRHLAETSLNSLTDDVQQFSAIEGGNVPRDQVRSSPARRLGIDIGGAVRAEDYRFAGGHDRADIPPRPDAAANCVVIPLLAVM